MYPEELHFDTAGDYIRFIQQHPEALIIYAVKTPTKSPSNRLGFLDES